MESISNQINATDGTNTFQTDLEALRNINKEIYESTQKELQEAEKVWEKARNSLIGLENKEVCILKSMVKPPQDVLGVLDACMCLMAGNVPKSCIKGDEKRNPTDLTWKGCCKMLGDWRFFRDQMLGAKKLIDEGKISEENIGNVRDYLNNEWFNVESVRMKSLPASQFCEAMINIMGYFDMRRKIFQTVKRAIGELAEGIQVNGTQERED